MTEAYEELINGLNNTELTMKVSDLTIAEFKQIVKEIVMEEISKVNMTQFTFPPTSPFYGPTKRDWMTDVWCSEMPLANPVTEISKDIIG